MNTQAKDRTRLMTEALLLLGKEDARGFRALTNHRPDLSFKLLERRGLIYRTTSCEPVRCQYRYRHGSVPTGDCRREGFVLSLRGRLVIELLRAGISFAAAAELASNCERDYAVTTIIHRRVGDFAERVIFGAELPRMPLSRCKHKNAAVEPRSAAERAVAGQSERMNHAERLIGDRIERTYQIRAAIAAARREAALLACEMSEKNDFPPSNISASAR
jgi:hypothetical protein